MAHRRTTKWAGWKKVNPSTRERTIMEKNCGKKCFLGPNKSFPICNKGTCKVNKKGVWAAYIRAREWGSKKMRASKKHSKSFYNKIARKSRKLLKL